MTALSTETFTPKDQTKKNDPITYKIKPLNSLQLTEVMQDGAKVLEGGIGLSFQGLLLCLKYGLEDKSVIEKMYSSHHAEVGMAIFKKSLLTEDERKN
jgi:hypothetical protein